MFIVQRRSLHSAINRQRGATLIEVMVAALILGVGLMGVLALQNRSIQFNQQAYYYSQANALLQDVAERMRVNTAQSRAYRTSFKSPLSTDLDCVSNTCSPEQIAEWDLAGWKNSVASILPSGDAEIISLDVDGGRGHRITVEFDGDKNFVGSEGKESLRLVVEI